KVRELPEIDDEFAKDVSEFDTLEELKADIKAKNLEAKERNSDNDVESQLIEQLVDMVEVEVPQAMVDRRVEQSVQDFAYRLSMQGMDINTYMQYTGSSMDDFKKNMEPQALNQVKARLALEQIVKLENITVSEEELAQEYDKLAKQYGLEVDKVKASIPEKEISKDKAVDKAVAFVKENAKISDVKEKSAKEEAKTEKKETSDKAKKTT
ncbi:MAG: trigger factor, partial [bacterium]|nr:trigger factor [bacterium]